MPYDAGILENIIADGQMTEARRFRWGKTRSNICLNCCDNAVEDLIHVWWTCEAWAEIRLQHPAVVVAYRSNGSQWPNCLARCAIATNEGPGNVGTELLSDMQRMFVKIRLARWDAHKTGTRELRGITPAMAYPWDWTPTSTFKHPNRCAATIPAATEAYGAQQQLAIAHWLANLQWSDTDDQRVSTMELLMDYEITTGFDFLYSRTTYDEKLDAPTPLHLQVAPKDTSDTRPSSPPGVESSPESGGARTDVDDAADEDQDALTSLRLQVAPTDSDPRPNSPPGVESSPESEGAEMDVDDDEEETVVSSAGTSSGSPDEGAVEISPVDIADDDSDSSSREGRAKKKVLKWTHPFAVKTQKFGALLQHRLRRDNGGKDVLPGQDVLVYHLRALGGRQVHGRTCRPILNAETLVAVKGMEKAMSEELESDELRKSKTGESLGLWIGKFRPHSFYPSSEVRGARAQHWFDEAASISERCKRYLPREQIMENAPPAEAPASAVRGDARVHTCVAHRKPFCRKCLEKYRKDKHTSLATCCYEHHREGDGQAPIWDFCTTHRLTRCGACVHDKNRPSLEHCCNRHHGCRGQRKITTMFAPKAPLTAGVDPNGRTTTDERVGEPPHTPIADPHG